MTKIIGSKQTFLEADNETAMEFLNTVADITRVPEYRKLMEYTHHNSTTRFQHCLNVAWYSFLWCKNGNLDYVSAARGGMLHDFYLYDTKEFRKTGASHNVVHPRQALSNAKKYFEVNEIMEDCILNHMWPSGKGKPHTVEGFVVSAADKYCASLEWGSKKAQQIVPLIRELIGEGDEEQ